MIKRKFKVEEKYLAALSASERKIVKVLEEVVSDAAKVYEQQLKDGFYPKEVTKERVESAAKKHALILSPFTFIEENSDHLRAVPYHEKYADLLKPLAEKIEEAAKLSTNPSFKKYLQARAKSLLDGSFKEADIAWLQVKNSRIDFSIGFFERYLDKLLFIKRVFQAHVGIVDEKETKLAEQVKEVLYSSAKLSFDKAHSTNIPMQGVQVLVERTPVTSGYMSDVMFTGEHFPSDLDVMQKYGSKIIIYRSHFKLRFDSLQHPIFKQIFEKRFAAKYSEKLLLRAAAGTILLYELGRQLHKYIGARERLKELYGPIDEANTIVSGIQHAKYLVVKGLITQDELEAIIIWHIVRMFADWSIYQRTKGLEKHVMGESIALSDYLSTGALQEKGGISWPNFSKMFFEMEALADKLVYLLQYGTYRETEKFVKEHVNLHNFERLGKKLKNLQANL